MTTHIDDIVLWFKRAVPEPEDKNFQVQLGCHLEELGEMLACLVPDQKCANTYIELCSQISKCASAFKQGDMHVTLPNDPNIKVEFIDSICDQHVTGIGLAVYKGMDVDLALNEVNDSLWSKFVNGEAVFDENKKIKKGPDYFKPDLTRFV